MPKIPRKKNKPKSKPAEHTNEVILSNIRIRKAANELVELGISLVKPELPNTDLVRRFWQTVIEMASALIGDEVVCQRCKAKAEKSNRPQTALPKEEKLYDEDPMPFGKYKGEPMGSLPQDYIEWLSREPWIEEWPSVLDYIDSVID